MGIVNKDLIEKIVYVKHKLRKIKNYITENEIPINIKLEHSNLNSLSVADKRYILHSLIEYNLGNAVRELNISPQEYFENNFAINGDIFELEKIAIMDRMINP